MSFTNRSNLSSRRWRALSIVACWQRHVWLERSRGSQLDEDNVWVGWRGFRTLGHQNHNP